MKIIRIASNKIENIIKIAGHYKVKYTDGISPELKEITLRNMESPEKAIQYVRQVTTRGKGRVVGKPEEIIIKQPSPPPQEIAPKKTEPKIPRNVKVIRPNPAKPETKPLPPQKQQGFRVDYYLDYASPGELKHTVYEDATSADEAEMLFDVEFPSDKFPRKTIVGRPKDLRVQVAPMSYDEQGRPVDMSKKQWITERGRENLPRDIALDRIKRELHQSE